MDLSFGTFHIIGVAHSIANGDYPTDPFTNKAMFMAKALYEEGHTVYYYGVEGGEVDCTEHIDIVPKEIFKKQYPDHASTVKTAFATAEGVAWDAFYKNGITEIQKRIKGDGSRDFALAFFGWPIQQITDHISCNIVEPGIGHPGPYPDGKAYRIWESYAWQNFMYGKEKRDDLDKWPTHYSTVINTMVDPRDFPFSDEKEDYFMFMGRVNWGKGISVAVEVANYFNKRLVVAGAGDLNLALPDNIDKKNIDFVGVLKHNEKCEYLKKAKAFFCPSLYIEPFGHVVVEAGMCGTPVLCTDFGAFTETVLQGKTGFRCRTFNDYIEGVNNLSSINPFECRQLAVERFSIKKLLPVYYKFFRDILTQRLDERGWYAVN